MKPVRIRPHTRHVRTANTNVARRPKREVHQAIYALPDYLQEELFVLLRKSIKRGEEVGVGFCIQKDGTATATTPCWGDAISCDASFDCYAPTRAGTFHTHPPGLEEQMDKSWGFPEPSIHDVEESVHAGEKVAWIGGVDPKTYDYVIVGWAMPDHDHINTTAPYIIRVYRRKT